MSVRQPLSADRLDVVEPRTDGAALTVHVVATTPDGTRAALHRARAWAAGLASHIVLLVPHVVPYAQSLEHPADPISFVAERFRRMAEEGDIDVDIRVCLCRPHGATLMPLLPREGPILIGGRTRRWWPTKAQAMAASLDRAGYRVMLVPL